MEPTIELLQTAIFTKNFLIKDDYEKSKILIGLKEKIGDIFDGQLVSIPIPNDAPPEFPRFTMNSQNKIYSCDVSLVRTNILFDVAVDMEKNQNNLMEKQKKVSLKLFNLFKEENIIINRIGFVAKAYYKKENGVDFLRSEFINEKKLKSPKELLIRYNQKNDLPLLKIEMNSLVTFSNKINNKEIINIQTDINTVAEIMPDINFCIDDKGLAVLDFSIEKTKEFINNFPVI